MSTGVRKPNWGRDAWVGSGRTGAAWYGSRFSRWRASSCWRSATCISAKYLPVRMVLRLSVLRLPRTSAVLRPMRRLPHRPRSRPALPMFSAPSAPASAWRARSSPRHRRRSHHRFPPPSICAGRRQRSTLNRSTTCSLTRAGRHWPDLGAGCIARCGLPECARAWGLRADCYGPVVATPHTIPLSHVVFQLCRSAL
jgi:hypothetical protein